MTSLLKLLITVAVLAGLIWGGMIALALFVEPEEREISVPVPPSRFEK
jgi:hypothetical protein